MLTGKQEGNKVNISATITSFGMNNSNNCTLEDIEAFGSSNFVKTLSLLCSRTQTPGKICRNAPYAQFLHTLMSSSYWHWSKPMNNVSKWFYDKQGYQSVLFCFDKFSIVGEKGSFSRHFTTDADIFHRFSHYLQRRLFKKQLDPPNEIS